MGTGEAESVGRFYRFACFSLFFEFFAFADRSQLYGLYSFLFDICGLFCFRRDLAYMLSMSAALFFAFLLSLVQLSSCVRCTVCNDNAGAAHDSADCPFNLTVAANVASLAAAGAVTIRYILPSFLVNYLGQRVLDTLVALSNVPRVLGVYDFTGKDVPTITKAVMDGVCTVQAAVLHASRCLVDANPVVKSSGEALLIVVTALEKTPVGIVVAHCTGPFRYLFHILSRFIVKDEQGKGKFALNEASTSADTNSSGRPPAVSIVLPRNAADFFTTLNLFGMTAHAIGMANYLALSPFLHAVIYRPMALENLSWMMAYEMLMVCFTHIEESTTGKGFVDITEGSQDNFNRLAAQQGESDFGASFRTHAGNASIKGRQSVAEEENTKWNKKCTSTNKAACATYNNGGTSGHSAKQLLPDGTCKYSHKCNKWVTDKGAAGRCGGAHPATVCDNPNKCDQPVP